MGDDAAVGIIHGPDDPLGLFLLGLVEARMNRADDEVEPCEYVIGEVEAPVVEDVHLDRAQEPKAVEALVEPGDFVHLTCEPVLVEPVGHGEALGMVAHRQILVAKGLCRLGHLLEAKAPVACVGVGVKVAADVVEGDELRHAPLAGGLYFAAVLPQLRRHPREAEGCVHFLFLGARDLLVAAEDSILADLQSLLLRHAAYGDIVLFGPGEVLQRRTVALRLEEAQIDLHPRAQHHRRAGLSLHRNPADVLVAGEDVHDTSAGAAAARRGAAARDHENVEVAHGLFPPAVAPGHRDAFHITMLLQIGDHLLGDFLGRGQEKPALLITVAHRLNLREQGLLELLTKALELPHPSVLEGGGERVDARYAELVVELLHTPRAEFRDPQQVEKPLGELAGNFFELSECACLHDLRDFLCDCRADALVVGEILPPLHELPDAGLQTGDGARRVAVGANAELILPLYGEEVGQLLEYLGDFGVSHGHSLNVLL